MALIIEGVKLDASITIKIDADHVLSISEVFGKDKTEAAILYKGQVMPHTVRMIPNIEALQDFIWEWCGDTHGL